VFFFSGVAGRSADPVDDAGPGGVVVARYSAGATER